MTINHIRRITLHLPQAYRDDAAHIAREAGRLIAAHTAMEYSCTTRQPASLSVRLQADGRSALALPGHIAGVFARQTERGKP